jgi:hypothetical protein
MPKGISRMKVPTSDSQTPFILLDLMGEEVREGDTVAIAGVSGKTPQLFLGLVTEIRICIKTARCFYTKIWKTGEYKFPTYLSIPLESSGTPSNQLIKISGIEFGLNQKRFATLLSIKSEFNAANPKIEENEDD